jgi:diamine N-acetyltransferase
MYTSLRNKAVQLRALEPEDLDLLYQWENNPSVWLVSGTFAPFSRFMLQKYLEDSHLDIYQTRQLRLMIGVVGDSEDNGKTVGAIDLFDFDPYHHRAGIGVLIADTADRNKGYASSALNLLIHYTFNVLSLHQLYCNIDTDNQISFQLFKKFGFEIVGEKKEWIKGPKGWIGEYMLQLIDPKVSPPEDL